MINTPCAWVCSRTKLVIRSYLPGPGGSSLQPEFAAHAAEFRRRRMIRDFDVEPAIVVRDDDELEILRGGENRLSHVGGQIRPEDHVVCVGADDEVRHFRAAATSPAPRCPATPSTGRSAVRSDRSPAPNASAAQTTAPTR